MEYLMQYGLFLAKAVTFVITIVAILIAVIALTSKQKAKKGELELTDLSEQINETKKSISEQLLSPVQLKAKHKEDKKRKKEKTKKDKAEAKEATKVESQSQLYVIDFKGSIDAKEVSSLREEVTAIISVATEKDEVFVRLESGGGMVHGYGLAASQLQRLKDKNIPLTISVDKVAASGGYMMACVADKIIAAPFSIIGSIGVIAQIPNFNKVLKKHDVEFEQLTAGQYKRTLTMFGENDELGREKFKQELEETHQLFKHFVSEHRPQLDIDKVATGEHWYGSQAFDLQLIDKVQTSDDYLLDQFEDKHIVQVRYQKSKKLAEKIGKSVAASVQTSLMTIMQTNISRMFK
ncbi:protease SohB [Psychromonas sp. 14N.309.X.WAT.B.A12]|uniref:protease SohB n=1 Tax=Psychromonas sp. 14N.309.X.WAT.B.A12 TaxID=2998322 RepID=UPI0025AFA4C5|nr:protease SohB [Psychromonas sp. 14N.309.X.WAT.B.A12]MDN2662138.1 protease SohB [Psychromonas sp. 14N.309.X.WAT.B.A12]